MKTFSSLLLPIGTDISSQFLFYIKQHLIDLPHPFASPYSFYSSNHSTTVPFSSLLLSFS